MARQKRKGSSKRFEPLKPDLGKQAADYLKRLDPVRAAAIVAAIDEYCRLGIGNAKALTGFKRWSRLRSGNFRIVFRIEAGVMHIPLIGDRKDIYQLARRVLG